jgi:photosystem II stability/assembly factor-like uncharacterized protein
MFSRASRLVFRSVLTPVLLLTSGPLACSSTPSSGGPNPAPDSGAADVVAGPTYEEAVLAAQWQVLAAGPKVPQGKQDDIYFVNAQRGFVASGGNSSVYRTTDGGNTWKSVFSKQTSYFRAVLFLDDNHGFVGNLGAGLSGDVSDTNVLYETKDGGDSWNPVTQITGDSPKGICNLVAIDSTHVAAIGRTNGPAHLMMSSDAGATWQATSLAEHFSMAIDAHFSSSTTGVLVGMGAGAPSACKIIRTEDGGKSFKTVFTASANNSLCWKVQFPTKDVGYVAIQQTASGPPAFAKTTDGGATWKELPLPPYPGSPTRGYAALAVGFITDKIGWVAAEGKTSPVYRTSDGGETWETETSITPPINRFRFVDKKTAYAVGGQVYKLTVDWPGQ